MPTTEGRPDRAAFEQATGSQFVLAIDADRAVELTLLETRHGHASARAGWESFSLLFDGPDPASFDQGTYLAEHGQMGSFPLFLVPVHTEGHEQHYEAVFNRPTPGPAPTEGEHP